MFASILKNCSRIVVQSQNIQSIIARTIAASVENVGNQHVVVVQAQQSDEKLKTMRFPSVWLRDNCRCDECFHGTAQSRRLNWDAFDMNVKVQELLANPTAKQIHIKWSDNHNSTYDLLWLEEREFDEQRRKKYLTEFYRPKTKHWAGAEFESIVENFHFQDVMNSDEALQSWLEALAVRGVAMINDAPLEQTVVRQLADRIGFIRRTTYGEEFLVQNKPGTQNVAYLSDALPLHTDLPYYEYKPSVNILHCMVQSKSKGGSNLLVDGFHLADRMKEEHAKDFKILTETLVDWNDIGGEDGRSFHNIWRAPVICLDAEGSYARINHSIPQRDSHFSVAFEEVVPWYEAYGKFVRLARTDAYAFKTKPGDVLTFNNIRLLHGRTGYDDTEENVRVIVGAYIDWDIIYAKLRVLKTARSRLVQEEKRRCK